MGAKYSVSPRSSWQLRTGYNLTSHAIDRYDERVPDWACSPETAIERGIDVPEMTDNINQKSDVRHNHVVYSCVGSMQDPFGFVFPIRTASDAPDTVLTTLSMDEISDGATRAYLDALVPRVIGDE